MKIIPAIDIMKGKTVRLEQGKYDRKLDYAMTPIEAARKWEAMGAGLIHVVDLDGARAGKPENFPIAQDIAQAVKIPVEIGGGFREKSDIEYALGLGIWRVVIGSRALEDINFAKDCLESFGERVILSIDAENMEPRVHGWEKGTGLDLLDVLEKFISFGAKEIIYTDIQKDGTLSGPSVENLEKILKQLDVKIISAGGVKTVEHVKELKKLEGLGLSGVIIGRALYEGTIDLKEAINVGEADNTVS